RRDPFLFLNARQLRERLVRARSEMAERPDPLRDLVDGGRELRVLLLEHRVKRVEQRPGDVPVIVVGLQIERVRVREEARQTFGDLRPILRRNPYVDGHSRLRITCRLESHSLPDPYNSRNCIIWNLTFGFPYGGSADTPADGEAAALFRRARGAPPFRQSRGGVPRVAIRVQRRDP